MKIQIDGRSVDARDALCAFRPCLRPGEWKGVLTPGRGYQYAPKSAWYWCCIRRSEHGCPDPAPAPDPEKARCCNAPRVREGKPDRWGRLPKRQRCQTCGVWLSGYSLDLARALEVIQ